VNVAEEDGRTPLHILAYKGHSEAVKVLLENKADVNAAEKNGRTPLHNAAYKGHDKAVRMLLENKADVNASEEDGRTPLHLASCKGRAEAVRLLLENKADVNAAGENGRTALHDASYEGHAEAVRMLLNRKPNVNTAAKDGWTPLHNAAYNGHAKMVKMLLEAGADVLVKDFVGDETPLMLAVCKLNWESASLLLSQGGYALLSAQNFLGQTCLDMMPASIGEDASASMWIRSVQTIDDRCDALVRKVSNEVGAQAIQVELFRGDVWEVSFKAGSEMPVILFRAFATVRASDFMCPSGSAAYYELQVLRMCQCPQWGFCCEAFDRVDSH
jgi:ankyrin repeat protein